MPDNINSIAIGRDDSSIGLVDLRTLAKVGSYKEKSNISGISCLQFSKSGRLLFSCSKEQNKICIWDVLNEEKTGEFGSDVHQDGVKSIALARNGLTLVSGGKGGTVAIWND